MDTIALLLDIITLIIRETQAGVDTNSDTMIESILDIYSNDGKKWKRRDAGATKKIVSLIQEMIETRKLGEELDLDGIRRRLTLLLSQDEDLKYSDDTDVILTMLQSITNPTDTKQECEDEIRRLKGYITRSHAKEKIKQIFNSKNRALSASGDVGEVFDFIDATIEDLDKIRATSSKSDEAIMGEIDLASEDLEKETASSVTEKHVFKTGCKALNRMLQGGIRTSEFTTISGLSHNYKTGFTLMTWLGMLLNNQPRECEPGQEPLAIWLSFEDDLINIVESLFRMIYMTEEGKDPDLGTMSLKGMIEIVQSRLQATGFRVKILRVNPSLWTYKDIFNKVASYKSKGFDTQILVVDYLDKLPSTGLGNGIMGSDKKDLVKRVRNHMAGLDIAFITPWQLSSGANALMKDGLGDTEFLSYVWDKSYYQGSNTLNTEIDLEIFVNKALIKNNPQAKYWLNVHRGKHKVPSVIPEEHMQFWTPFPKEGMIPLDEGTSRDLSVSNPSTGGGAGMSANMFV